MSSESELLRRTIRPDRQNPGIAVGFHGVDAGAGQDCVERVGEPAGAVADEKPEGSGTVVEIHQQVACLLGSPCSGRMARGPQDVHVPAANIEGEEHIDPLQRHSAVNMEEVALPAPMWV